MKKTFCLLLLTTLLNASSQTDSLPLSKKNILSLEVDPAPFILGGYSISLRYIPKKTGRMSFMFSSYGSSFPDAMMDKTNYNKGFRNLKIKPSTAFFLDYFLNNKQKGWHLGPSIFAYSKTVELKNYPGNISFYSLYPNLRLGYLFKISNSGFYINPWLNVGKEIFISGEKATNEMEYSLNAYSYIVALHLGYRISF